MRFYRKYHFFYISPRAVGFLFIILAFLLAAVILNMRFLKLAKEIAASRAHYIMVTVVNECVNSCFSDTKSYSDLIIIQKDVNGNITAINTDISKINNLKSVIAAKVIERLNSYETTDIKVPVSNLFGVSVFSSVGPKVPMKVMPLSDIEMSFNDKFVSAGINQTKFEINLNLKTNLSMVMPMVHGKTTVNTTVPIAQAVIVGIVPGQYTFVDTKEPGGEETLNLLE